MYNDAYAVVGYKGVAKPVKHFPPEMLDSYMIDNDFEFAANNRKRILAEWQKRYDSKSDPKKKVSFFIDDSLIPLYWIRLSIPHSIFSN